MVAACFRHLLRQWFCDEQCGRYFRKFVLVVVALSCAACKPSIGTSNQSSPDADGIAAKTAGLSAEIEHEIQSFCGDCHRMPNPASFPKSAWRDEVRRGFEFYYTSGRTDLKIPKQSDVTQYFVSRAPEKFAVREVKPLNNGWIARFEKQDISISDVRSPATSHVAVVDLGPPLGKGILFSDMAAGGVYFSAITTQHRASDQLIKLGQLSHPAGIQVVDLNEDGLQDLVVAELGSFLPEDHQRGKVIALMQSQDQPGVFQQQVLVEGIGRVASVESADFNQDGVTDLLVAEFGWRTTGSVFILRREKNDSPLGSWRKEIIDPRQGAIHLPVYDFNNDGFPDYVSLISQHHEKLDVMLNDGKGAFKRVSIFEAPCPSYGSSGIKLRDVNRDGRMDIVYSNGDSFDSFVLKPFHGVKWFENVGEEKFVEHQVGYLPGVHRALPGDLDGDGEFEMVGGSFVPEQLLPQLEEQGAESIVVFKPTSDGKYEKHVLSKGDCIHAAMELQDINGDGKDDLIIGNFCDTKHPGAALTIWYSKP
jgi:hypothetical protein